jgi:hypothetical protein
MCNYYINCSVVGEALIICHEPDRLDLAYVTVVEIPFNNIISLDLRHVDVGGSTTDLRGLVDR